MKRLYRMSLGCFFLGVFITNGVIYMFSETPSVWGGVVSMASWILMWIFIAMQGGKPLSEKEKLYAGFSMGTAVCYLLYHIFIGALPDTLILISLFLAVCFCAEAMAIGLWWSEVSPPE